MAKNRPGGMMTYILRRLLLMIPTMIGITICTFAICQFVPGGPIDQMKLRLAGGDGREGGSGSSKTQQLTLPDDQIAKLKAYYGFDKPIHVQYLHYMKNLLKGDLGSSFRFSRSVAGLIGERLPVSIYFGIITMVLTYGVCIPLGVLKALRHRTHIDNATSVIIFIGYAIPSYALGAVLLNVLAVKYGMFPLGGFEPEGYADLSFWMKVKTKLHHTVLPIICYMVGRFAFMTMLMKNSLMENTSADYIKTALAKGLNWRTAVFTHAFRNSLIPMATSFGHNISFFLVGNLFIERVFSIPGIGLLSFEAIQTRDFPIVMGMVVIGSLLALIGNLLSDICVASVDPRVRFG